MLNKKASRESSIVVVKHCNDKSMFRVPATPLGSDLYAYLIFLSVSFCNSQILNKSWKIHTKSPAKAK